MLYDNKIFIGKSNDEKIYIYPKMANRHGLIAGATGTGKTITLKVLAESFSDLGVPVFLADMKGDLSGMCELGVLDDNLKKRIEKYKLEEVGFKFDKYPTEFWDVFAKGGVPLRTTISEMGPLLLAKILKLNEVQEDVLTVIFKIADDNNLLLIDTKDLKAMLQYVGEHSDEFKLQYGNMSSQSLGAIVRSIVALEAEGAENFFMEPALNIADLFMVGSKGTINVLDCRELIHKPNMYVTFMLWLLSELFENLPEVGDLEKPRMVFFFDGAHLLFDEISSDLLEKVEQIVKLIRSKGIGIYFITQNPKDIPDGVLAQLGNKIQHALRAYTPTEQKAAKAAAASFRENSNFNTYDTLLELGIGEALVSILDEKGIPTVVERVNILPPQSLMGVLDEVTREKHLKLSNMALRYAKSVDNDSAYEFLTRLGVEEENAKAEAEKLKEEEKRKSKEEKALLKQQEKEKKAQEKRVKSVYKNAGSSAAGTIGREIGKEFGNMIGGKFGKKIGSNVGSSLGRGLFKTLFKS